MKKLITLLMVTLLCTGATFAQRGSQTGRGHSQGGSASKKSTVFYLGPKVGATFTTMTQPDQCDLYDAMGIGFSAGVTAKARFGRASDLSPAGTGKFGAGLELKYKQNNVKTIGIDEDGKQDANLNISYFELPLFVQFYPFYKSDAMNTFYIEAGPDIAGTLSRSPKALTVDNLTGNFSAISFKVDDLKGFDVRFLAGLGYEFAASKNSKHEAENLIGINARYYMGTSKLAGNFASKMNTFEISLSWMFSLGKL